MKKQREEKRNQSVAMNLTESQKLAVEKLAAKWDMPMAVIGRLLIRHYVGWEISLRELLQKRKGIDGPDNGFKESRNCRVYVRLNREEMQQLTLRSDKDSYFPGAAARILMELFIANVISKDDILE